jgi:hypothetical protein
MPQNPIIPVTVPITAPITTPSMTPVVGRTPAPPSGLAKGGVVGDAKPRHKGAVHKGR